MKYPDGSAVNLAQQMMAEQQSSLLLVEQPRLTTAAGLMTCGMARLEHATSDSILSDTGVSAL